ncbi:MAG: hypothetical protein HY814_10400 [Candidatus Riflebacteria bacterium]|nr:hypothetical protein [Candidatus Riflebacteria bacterium]
MRTSHLLTALLAFVLSCDSLLAQSIGEVMFKRGVSKTLLVLFQQMDEVSKQYATGGSQERSRDELAAYSSALSRPIREASPELGAALSMLPVASVNSPEMKDHAFRLLTAFHGVKDNGGESAISNCLEFQISARAYLKALDLLPQPKPPTFGRTEWRWSPTYEGLNQQ